MNIYQSQGKNVTGPSVTSYFVLMNMTRWALVCHGSWFTTVLSGRLTLIGCPSLQMLWLVHLSFAFLPWAAQAAESAESKPFCDPELQTEAAVMNEAQGPPQTSAVTKTRDSALDVLLGFWHRPKKKYVYIYSERVSLLLLRYSNCIVMTVLSEVIPWWITVAQSHVFELNRLFDAAVLRHSKK